MTCRAPALLVPAVLAVCLVTDAAPARPTDVTRVAARASLWQQPADIAEQDLFNGPWGAQRAPQPGVTYTFLERKHSGINPGMTVRDPEGRKWSVKQARPEGRSDEGPIEVAVSRILSAVGYHQPPVYYLRSFTLRDDWGTHVEAGGRFRLHDRSLTDLGEWSWMKNPFAGTTPYRGLLAILMMLASSDLKDGNNTVYEYREGDVVEQWYVVRDLGTALGETGRLAPRKGDPDVFERQRFILGITGGFVDFDYRGRHPELVRARITPDDVRWASALLSQLSDRQWADAFRAGGYTPQVADRFIRKLRDHIARGRHLGQGAQTDAPLARP